MKWRPIVFFRFDPSAPGTKEYLPSAGLHRFCRFCLRDESQLSSKNFKKDAHAVPEFLGNHYLLSSEECDDCNRVGSRLEDDLAKHLIFHRVISRIEGKEGTAKHRFGTSPSSLSFDLANRRIMVERKIGDDSLVVLRTPVGLRYRIKVPGYRPMNALRALARLPVMLVAKEELPGLDHIRRWLRSEIHWPTPVIDEAFIPETGPLADVTIAIDRNDGARAGEPHFRIGLKYSQLLLSFHLPGPDMAISEVPLPLSGNADRISVNDRQC